MNAHSMTLTIPGIVEALKTRRVETNRANKRRLGDVSIALVMCANWEKDVPPVAATGDFALDLKLADAFKMLCFLPGTSPRLNYLARAVRPDIAPNDARYIATLKRWWLQIYDRERKTA